MRKVLSIGVLIAIGFILDTVALFTSGWIVVNLYFKTLYIGIIPFQDGSQPSWFVTSSWLMFISFLLSILLCVAYAHVMRKIHHCGCSHSIRHSFNVISLLSVIISLFEIVSFILTVSNLNDYSFFLSNSVNLGYSCYLALASSIVLLAVSFISQHVRHYDCC